ncbi:MAG: LPS assembly lipoprotein LptE [Alphaproteobacteria bacterium]|nr:LPS assembly lipoprotein LptE [Alphaproteobacteria bacterium]
MSWHRSRRALAALLLAAAAAGCGFQPLYGDRSSNADAAAELAAVKINTISDRNGQILHNLLLDRINSKGRPAAALYALDIQLTEQKASVGIIKDSTATLAQLSSTANYTLYDLKKKVVLQQGRSRSFTSYNIVESNFATLAAEHDARERTLRELADDITTKVAVFLSSRSGS